MLVNSNAVDPVEAFPGVLRRTLSWGERVMLSMTEVAEGSEMPEHAHEHEQITYIVRGKLEFRLGDETHILGPGDCIIVPSNVPHYGKGLEATTAIDAFAPPREDFK